MWNEEKVFKWKMKLLFLFHRIKWSEKERVNILMIFSRVNLSEDVIDGLLVIRIHFFFESS